TVNIIPATGYRLETVIVNDTDMTDTMTGNVLTLRSITSPSTIDIKFTPTSAINSIEAAASVVSTEWYSITGVRIAEPTNTYTGPYIKITRYSDGSVTREKMINY
ncbi:MAG: hypothetical protein K2M76_04230, partial [Muribaculaceae bacterium]|nr:hypothetical protein [Muribaculaceae bacterium]